MRNAVSDTASRYCTLALAPLRAAGAALACAVSVLALPAWATGSTDDFESYTVGNFPSAQWQDAALLFPEPPSFATPSAAVASTTGATGAATQALVLADRVALVSGVYQSVPVSTQYTLAADIRIDRYSNNSLADPSDWAMQLTFAQATRTLYTAPQAGIYAASLSQGWRLFLIEDTGPISADIDLGAVATPGSWYRVAFELDTTLGSYKVQIDDMTAGQNVVSQTGVFAGWTAANGQYDSVAFFSGHDTSNAAVTIANQATVDNINVTAVPEPATAWLWAAGLGAAGWLRRRKAGER